MGVRWQLGSHDARACKMAELGSRRAWYKLFLKSQPQENTFATLWNPATAERLFLGYLSKWPWKRKRTEF